MITKAEEIQFYKAIYILAFGKEDHFFYTNDSQTIYSFFKETFCGEDLRLRTLLLSKLLYFDSTLNPDRKHALRVKSKEISAFIVPPQE